MTFNGTTFSGTPRTVGSWTITVTAKDQSNYTASTTFTVTTPNAAPQVAHAIPAQSAPAGETWSYTVPSNTFVDYNGDALTWSAYGTVQTLIIAPDPDDPGGGGGGGGGTPPPDLPWLSFNAATRTFTGIPPAQGTFILVVHATDTAGAVGSTSFTLNVGAPSNSAPVLNAAIPDQTATAIGSAWSYTIPSTAFSDPDGDALTYSATGMPAWMSFTSSTRKFSGTPSAVGSWTITVTAADPSGASKTDSFVVTTPNAAPTVGSAIADQSAAVGTAWSFTVPSGTFTDANGDALAWSANTVTTLAGLIVDPGDPGDGGGGGGGGGTTTGALPSWLTFSASTHKFTGTPPVQGTLQLQVRVEDGSGGVATDTFTLTIGAAPNHAPVVATPIPDQTAVATGGAWSYVVPAGTFTDADGDAMTYGATGMPSWMAFNATTRTFSGTPATVGSWAITITATDSHGAAKTDTFTVTTPNVAPYVVGASPDKAATVGQAFSYTFPAFGDRNGQALTYTLAGAPSWMTFNASTRTMSGTPTSAATYTLTVTASDGSLAASDSFTLTVSSVPVENRAPVVNRPLVDQYEFLDYTFPSDTFVDPDGDALTYTYVVSPTSSLITFDAATRTFSGNPPGGKYGKTFTITVTASDGHGHSASDSFTLDVSGYMEEPFAPSGQNGSGNTGIVPPSGGDGDDRTARGRGNDRDDRMEHGHGNDRDDRTEHGRGNDRDDRAEHGRGHDNDDHGNGNGNGDGNENGHGNGHGNGGHDSHGHGGDGHDGHGHHGGGDPAPTPDPDPTPTPDPTPQPPADGGTKHDADLFDAIAAMEQQFASDQVAAEVAAREAAAQQGHETAYNGDGQPNPDDPNDPDNGGTTGTGGTGTPQPNVQELWFTYDAENRVQVVNGKLSNGQIVVAADGTEDVASYALQYDAAGNAVSRTTVESRKQTDGSTIEVTKVARSSYTARGQLENEYSEAAPGGATGVVARHYYDNAGHETEVREFYAPGETWWVRNTQGIRNTPPGEDPDPDTGTEVDVGGDLSHQTLTTYDADGRTTAVTEKGRNGSLWVNDPAKATDPAALSTLSQVSYTSYDNAGMLRTYEYHHLLATGDSPGGNYTHTYTTTYEARDSYLEKSVTGTSNDTNYEATTTSSTYDTMGRRVALTQTTPISGQSPLTYLRYFSYDAEGGILTRRDGTLENGVFTAGENAVQHYTYVNGQQVAALGEDGKIDAASQLTAFDSSEQGAEPTLVMEGDTLQSIAQRVYGNPSLWYVLAAANAVSDADLVAGTTLKAPEVKTTANDASTFKPFDPSSIEGPTTPSLPYITPPPKHHCNALATVLMIVVAVVVTYFTAGAAGTYFAGMQAAAAGTTAATVTGASVLTGASVASIGWSATLASAAIGGAAGSIASQAIGSAMGATSFSWRNVAAAGITTALTAGIGAGLQQVGAFTQGAKVAGQLNKIGQTVQGVAGYGASVVGQAATGQDAHFSWAAVAATAVGSALSANLGGKLPLTKGGTKSGRFLNDFEGYLVGGGSSATARRLFGLGEQDWGQVAMDAFGNAVGNTVIDGVVQAQAVKKLSAEGRAYYEDKIRNGADPHITLARAQHYETQGPSGFLNTGLWGGCSDPRPLRVAYWRKRSGTCSGHAGRNRKPGPFPAGCRGRRACLLRQHRFRWNDEQLSRDAGSDESGDLRREFVRHGWR
jgi:LysM repeat protein